MTKILLSKPSGLQYSASKNIMAVHEIIIFTRLVFFLFNLPKTPSKPVIPNAIKIIPNQYPMTIIAIPAIIKAPFMICLNELLSDVFLNK